LVISKSRYLQAGDLALVFLACVFPIHLWAIWNLMQVIPAWILRSTPWELVGVIAYIQMVALIESVILFGFLFSLGLLLPNKLFAHKFIANSSAFILLHSAWFVAMHYYYDSIRLWGAANLLLLVLALLFTNILSYLLVNRSQKFEEVLKAATKRVSVLSVIYVSFSLVSLFIVVLRNILEGFLS
jgi:hypothetical protein